MAERKNSKELPIELRIPMPWGYVAGCWYGDQNTRPLLALHGWQDNAGSFARLAPLIAPHRSILAIDLPGHGRSSHFPGGVYYHFHDFLRSVHRIACHYKWKQISFLGHSMGAAIGFHYAAYFPKMVDMIIAIDAITLPTMDPDVEITFVTTVIDGTFKEDDRFQLPPGLHTYDSFKEMLHYGSNQSIELENCKYLLERSVRRAESNPDMFYSSRDRRVKLVDMVFTQSELRLALASRVRNIRYLVLKAESEFLNLDHLREVIKVLPENNSTFEFHTLHGESHHVHLNKPQLVAGIVVPFVSAYSGTDDKPEAKL